MSSCHTHHNYSDHHMPHLQTMVTSCNACGWFLEDVYDLCRKLKRRSLQREEILEKFQGHDCPNDCDGRLVRVPVTQRMSRYGNTPIESAVRIAGLRAYT